MAEKEPKKKARIGTMKGLMMMILAVAPDAIQGLIALIGMVVVGVAVNTVISAFIWMIFLIWFMKSDVPILNVRRGLAFGATSLAEIIPIINDVPFWTMGIAFIIASTRAEDALTGASIGGLFSKFNPLSKIINKAV